MQRSSEDDQKIYLFIISMRAIPYTIYPDNMYLFKVINRNIRKKVWNMFKVNNKRDSEISKNAFFTEHLWASASENKVSACETYV